MALGHPHERIHLPPPEHRSRIAEIAKVGEEVASLRERHGAAYQDLTELKHKVDAAKLADSKAAADALRAGKPAPKPTVPAAEKAVDAQQSKLAALEQAVGDAEADLEAAIEEHRPAVLEQLGTEVEADRLACRKLAEDLAAKTRAMQETKALRGWLKNPILAFRPGAYGGQVAGLLKPNGDRYGVSELVDELVSTFAPPPPPAPEPPHRRNQWPNMGAPVVSGGG